MDTKDVIENFVRVYNEPGSNVYPLYGERVDWIEMPSGRRGGKEELFDALRQSRDFLKDLRLDVLSIVANGPDGVLESSFSAAAVKDGSPIKARIIWFFTAEGGKITKEHDYSIVTK